MKFIFEILAYITQKNSQYKMTEERMKSGKCLSGKHKKEMFVGAAVEDGYDVIGCAKALKETDGEVHTLVDIGYSSSTEVIK